MAAVVSIIGRRGLRIELHDENLSYKYKYKHLAFTITSRVA